MKISKGFLPGLARWTERLPVITVAGVALCLSVVCPTASLGQSGPPAPDTSRMILNIFHFDDTNTWLSTYGSAPKAFSGIKGVPSWQSNAVLIAGTSAFLRYNEIETNGNTNILCPVGTIWTWFVPQNWNSGTGPGVYGRLFEMGTYTTNGNVGWL